MNIKELLEYGKENLIKKEEAYRLSKMILQNLLNVNNTYLIINDDEEMKPLLVNEFKREIDLLNRGLPIQYITNHQEFMKLNFYVNKNVLIPQPDTEILVEEVIKICNNKTHLLSYNILDLCTGSGAIGIAIAKYVKNAKVTLLDVSENALKIAQKNAEQNNVNNQCKFVLSNMFKEIKEKFNIIVSNPPYIKTDIIKTLSKIVIIT